MSSPEAPSHGDAYRDPNQPDDRYTYKPDPDSPSGIPDDLPWEWTRDGQLMNWLADGELPAGLVPVWRLDDVVRAEPDDGRRWRYDPNPIDDEHPWKLEDGRQPPFWVGDDDLPANPVLVERDGQPVEGASKDGAA